MEEGGGGHGKRHGGRQRCAVGRVEARWWPGEVRKVVVVLGPRGIDRRDSDAGELVGGTGPPCNVNGEPAVTCAVTCSVCLEYSSRSGTFSLISNLKVIGCSSLRGGGVN